MIERLEIDPVIAGDSSVDRHTGETIAWEDSVNEEDVDAFCRGLDVPVVLTTASDHD